MHALTKYINGHTDVIMGAVITKSEELNAKIKFIQHSKNKLTKVLVTKINLM